MCERNRDQIVVQIPDHMSDYRENRLRAGLSDKIGIDVCLFEEIQKLWDLKIRTTGCCCGHNERDPYIGVFSEDIPKMKELGYRVQFNPHRPYAQDTFYPVSIPLPPFLSGNTSHPLSKSVGLRAS